MLRARAGGRDRDAGRDAAARGGQGDGGAQTLLYAGDWLEVRGERQGWLQVYDHRHERPGYVRPSQVRTFPVDEKRGGRAGGGHRLRARSAGRGVARHRATRRCSCARRRRARVGAEVFDALGGMAERLGRRASSKWARPNDATLAAQIEVAESYGIKFNRSSYRASARGARASATTARPIVACWRCRRRRRRRRARRSG